MPDELYDRLCMEVDPKIGTGNRKLDTFFRKHFDPSTGMWVLKHPEQGKLEAIYQRVWREGRAAS